MDAWLDAADELVPGNHSANDVLASRPFVHMTGPNGDSLLRQWPLETKPERIAAVARALAAMHTTAGDVIPHILANPSSPESVTTTVKDRLYTAQTWLPGRPLGRFGGFITPDGDPITLPLPETAHATDVINQAAAVIASCHTASESVDKSGLPVATISILMARVRKYWFEHRKILGEHAAEERDIRRWLRCGNRMIPTASDLLRNEPSSITDTSVILHNDLWPENILIQGQDTGRKLTGIVGWSHAAVGSPVLDIAHLAVNMQGWSAALTESIIDAYSDARELRPDQRRIIPAVAGLLMVELVGEMLRLSYVDDRMIGHEATSVLRSGMKTMLDSLERVTNILAPDIAQTERFNRQRRDGTFATGPARKSRAPGARTPRKPRQK